MNITELDQFNLGDAIKFNNKLNPKLWDADEHLHPKVRDQLLKIADDFREFLGVDNLQVKDVTISGSNAAYTYTPYSDVDLHLVVDLPEADNNEVYRELFDAKKYQYNDQHNFKIGSYNIELYVENANKPPHSQGIYSLVHNKWIDVPKRRHPKLDDISICSKYEDLSHRIEQAVESNDFKTISTLATKIKNMRQAGLDKHGEFASENLAYKALRNQGLIDKLYTARNAAKDQALSIKEKKEKPRFTYGFQSEDAGLTWDGVSPTTDMFTNETKEEKISDEDILKDFVDFCVKELKIDSMPVIKLRKDPQWPVIHKTFGRYIDDRKMLEVAFGQRHIMDVLRTVAHELTHKHQHERETVPGDAGETGSPWENEANARAGMLMRDYGRLHPELFDSAQDDNLYIDESAADAVRATAVIACLLTGGSLTGCATAPQQTSTQQVLKTGQDIGRTVQTAKKITRAGTEAEVQQELRNILRGVSGRPEELNHSNILRIWRKIQGPPPVQSEPESPEYGPSPPKKRMPQYEGASGYIPTKAQAKDPRFSMALTKDIRPGQLGKEANKLKLKTDKQGHPQVANPNGLFEELMLELQLAKEGINAPVNKIKDDEQYYRFILGKARLGRPLTRAEQDYVKMYQVYRQQKLAEDKELEEVKMSPSALEKFAASDAAKGIRAGFEAELIFRDTQGSSDDIDPEPNYDADERAYSIAQVVEFFTQDEYGYGLSDRERNRLEERLDEAYMEWRDSQMTDDFRNEAEDLVREVHLDEVPLSERIIRVLTDGMEIDDAEADKILAVGVDSPKFNTSKEQQAYAEQNPDYKIYLEALDDAEAILDEEVETSIKKQDGYYDQALDDYRDNWAGDDDSFFSDIGLRWMSDIANEYGLDWPVWDMDNQRNNGSRSWEDIGAELQAVVDMPVVVSDNYHSAARKEGQWIIEPDGSLSPDDQSEEAGLEIVSPPMPLLMALEKLKAVTDWANDPNGGNAYTNRSTGLHMGVSLPTRGGDVDYVKLILFMGDKYVQEQFGRTANNFCASALDKFKQNIKGGKSDPAGVIKLLKHGLTELAFKELQKGVGTSKYTSAHLQNGYIEFRSPGGDWLAKADEEINILENTMLRFARAMAIAGDPSADRQEYAKKLYKLVTQDNEQYTDQLRLFSEFSAGTIDKEQLKKQWAEKTIGKEKKINQFFKLYQKVNGVWTAVPGAEYRGFQEDEVKNRVWAKYGREALDSGEYQLVNMSDNQEWEVYDVKTDKTLEIVQGATKGEAADKVFDKYANQGIGFNVRAYVDPATMTPRAKLAKRIAQTKKPTDYNYEIVNLSDVNLRVVDQFYADSKQEADKTFDKWLAMKDLPNDTHNYGYRPRKQEAAVKDIAPDVAQNFNQTNNATDRVGSWAIYDVTLGREISRMDNVPWQQASDRADELERSTGHNMSVRGLQENFADGKGPGRPGDSQRHGIPKGATIAQLEKAAKAPGRKGQLARWQLNMRRGKKK